MIRLRKGAEPDVLARNGVSWRDRLLEKYERGETPPAIDLYRYRHPEIKQALVAETYGKCAYCESKVLHIHHGDVEHIYPKSLDRALTFSWENLTLSCEICNQRKSDSDPYLRNIIDPYLIDPEAHIFFVGALPASKGTAHGRWTIAILGLGRPELVEARLEHLRRLTILVETILDLGNPLPVRRTLYNDFLNSETGPDRPYSAMARSVLSLLDAQLEEGFHV